VTEKKKTRSDEEPETGMGTVVAKSTKKEDNRWLKDRVALSVLSEASDNAGSTSDDKSW